MEHNEFTRSCEELLLSPEFQHLVTALEFREPNLWQALRISRSEVLISRFLAWLLDPHGNHSLGDGFLKMLVVEALKTEIGREADITPVEVLLMDLSDVVVKTEFRLGRRRCDIAVFTPEEATDPSGGFLCLIENKIGATEGHDQTTDYHEIGLVTFPRERHPHRVCIYLSPDGVPPLSQEFIPLSYRSVLTVLDNLLATTDMPETERFLLGQFRENIVRGVAMDPKTIDLAQAVYEQHRDVFEFVIQNVDRELGPNGGEPSHWDGRSRFFNVGEMAGSGYRWADCLKYGFICAGGSRKFRRSMSRFEEDDEIYAYVSGRGYVGFGTVRGKAVQFRKATLADGRRLADVDLVGEYDDSEDDDTCDWIVLVDWEHAVDKDDAIRLENITRLTTCRIYDHRKGIAEQARSGLAKSVSQRELR